MPLPLPFQAKVGFFVRPTSVPSQTVVTGLGFKPRVVILMEAGNTGEDEWQGTGTGAEKTGIAVSMFTAEEFVSLFESTNDNASSQDVRSGIHQKAHRLEDTDGLILSVAPSATLDEDGFTLTWAEAETPASIIGYLALGGDTLRTAIKKWQVPETSGVIESHAVTGVGFRPDAVLHLFRDRNAFDPTFTGDWPDGDFSEGSPPIGLCIGAMDADGNQWAARVANLGGHITVRGLEEDHTLIEPHPLTQFRASFESMDVDGFSLRVHSPGGTPGWVASLCLSGILARVGVFATAASPQTVTGVGFEPSAILLAGVMHDATYGGELGVDTDIQLGLGMATADDEQFGVSHVDLDGEDPSVSEKLTRTEWLYHIRNADETAQFTAFTSDGWSMTWTPANGDALRIGYMALGSIPRPTHLIELELDGPGNGWTNVSEDLMLDSPGIDIDYGIAGAGPLDLVASTGRMRFALNNSEDNSAQARGYYSPRHPNCRPGFELGIGVRYTYLVSETDGYGKFIGRLRDIDPKAGIHRERKTVCEAVDWMNEAAITKFNLPTQIDESAEAVLQAVVEEVPRQPEALNFDTADSTFPYALDNGRTEGTVVLTEIQRICQSEFGRCYVRGGANYWGRLRFEARTARLTPAPVATFDGTMQGLDCPSSTGKIRNRAVVIAHPRRVDTGNTTVLFAKPDHSNPQVAPGQTFRLSGRYVDPNNPNARVGGTDMQSPTATTDYLMNSLANGSGTNLTGDFSVAAFYGANQVDYEITNNGASTGFVTKLQARGRGLYDYDPLESDERDADSIALMGESKVTLDMPYQSSAVVAAEIATFLLETWTAPGVAEGALKFIPRDATEEQIAMSLDIGDPITISEELSGLNGVYFIQGVGIRITGDATTFTWGVQRALVADYWILGTSELGVDTVLAPL